MKQENNIWVSSDFHLSHKNITGPKLSNWKSGYRNFDSIEQMNDTIINGINNSVQQDDQLLYLGDFYFGDRDRMQEMRDRIVCKNIIYILGNHDKHGSGNKVIDGKLEFRDNTREIKKVFGIQNVFTTLEFDMNGILFFLSHYAHRVWDKSHRNAIHLYGHSHDGLDKYDEEWGKSMDCSIESAFRIFKEWRPMNLVKEIVPIMNKRTVKIVDHHGDGSEVK